MTALYVPGTDETDPKKLIMSQQLVAGQTSTNTTAIAALNAATYVNSVAARTGALTLNTASGITNSANDILLSQTSASQFGAVKVDGTTITAAAGVISTVNPLPAPIHASLGADVLLNNSANYFDGPSVAQGTVGTWFASGKVSLTDSGGAATTFFCKLWDGTTVIDSGAVTLTANANFGVTMALSGYLVTPAANIRISCRDVNATTGKILFNASGNSKDSTISAYRIA